MGCHDDDWESKRREHTFNEARRVIDHQQQILSDIDDKAMRTVRLTAIVVGVFATAARVAGPGVFHRPLAFFGGIVLFCSIGVGVFTYSESDLFLGPNQNYVNWLNEDKFEDWQDDYLTSMGYWIDENYDDIEWNGDLLLFTQVLFILGLALVSLSLLL